MSLIFVELAKKLETSIFYFFALPPTLMRNPLTIKISKQRGEITHFPLTSGFGDVETHGRASLQIP